MSDVGDDEVAASAPSHPSHALSPTSSTPPPPARVIGLPTMFGEVLERDVTFCVDTSGSMFNCLHAVKEQLIETLMKHAQRDGDTTFNIVEFNSEVTQWADKMVACTPETVQVAADWIRKLSAKTGTNTLDALLTALQDNACRAVYLVTDGLPDTFAEEILDTVIEATKGRPIHCVYLTRNKAETPAVEFLEDLAVESFGSFHIVTLTTHGCVERMTPIYRAEHASERVIRTVNNTLHPNFKACSVSTTLQIDPDEVLGGLPRSALLGTPPYSPYMPPWWGWRWWGLGMLPLRYYYPSTWSRYRPAKSWLQAHDKLMEGPESLGMSPGAGALLIGKKVLARRIADGYFYMGTVQSQILEEKFLIAFGPCKHGKYRETTYQDTFVFDIVDYCDAQRHTIITGDYVLAPWEPEGERFGPGIVIDGQEKRQAVGGHLEGPEDHQLTVAFSNGRTEKVCPEKAIWIPQPIHERVSLELKMPQATRSSFMTTEHYPLENLPGYPTSGPKANPPEYFTPNYYNIEPTPYYGGWDRWVYPEYLGYYPPYPLVIRRRREESWKVVDSENEDEVIPGTDMTRRQLDQRVLSQLQEHQLNGAQRADVQRHAQQVEASHNAARLLKRREKQEENTLKKSVTFSESNLVQDVLEERPKPTSESLDADSGIASSPELDVDHGQDHLQENYDTRHSYDTRSSHDTRSFGINTDSSLLYPPRRSITDRPPWQYWKNDPAPPVSRSRGGGGGGGGGGSAHGPFRETALQAPLEARDQRKPPYAVEWTSPAFKYVDTFAKHDYSNSVEECLHTPHPPQSRLYKSQDLNYRVPETQPPTDDEKADKRREHRRKRHILRQMAWQERLAEEDCMKLLMQDGHRERVQAQIAREQERQKQEHQMISKAREAKKKISAELRARIEANELREKERDEQRIGVMKLRRERREAIETQRQKEMEETTERREAIRRQNCVSRHNIITNQLEEANAKVATIDKQHRNAKLQRIHHFQRLEDTAQAKKDIRVAVTDQHLALYRSQVFP